MTIHLPAGPSFAKSRPWRHPVVAFPLVQWGQQGDSAGVHSSQTNAGHMQPPLNVEPKWTSRWPWRRADVVVEWTIMKDQRHFELARPALVDDGISRDEAYVDRQPPWALKTAQ